MESGSGKTELVKEASQRILNKKKDIYILYLDVVNDKFISDDFFENLLKSSYYHTQFRRNICLSVPQKYSFSNYIKKNKMASLTLKHGFNFIRSLISSVIPNRSIIDYPWEEVATEVKEEIFESDLFLRYFMNIAKKTRVNIIIDNYQFLSEEIKVKFEDALNTVTKGISLTIINRTINKSSYINEMGTLDKFTLSVLNLTYLSEKECKNLLSTQIKDIDNAKLEQIWRLTKGNYKEISLIINKISEDPTSEILSISDIYLNLSDIQRNILIISSIFPAGMTKDVVINYIKSIIEDKGEASTALNSLINAGFIYINGTANDKVKISHESIIRTILNQTEDSDLRIVTKNLKVYLERTIASMGKSGELAYLIHCFVNISSIDELKHNLDFIKELIEIEYKKNSYFYIVNLSKKIIDLVEFLPEKYLHYILNSHQWTSNFKDGLHIFQKLKHLSYSNSFKLYYPRFLIQKYEFNEALEQLEKLNTTSGTLLYKLNAYGHLGKDSEALKLLDETISSVEKDDFYYIILRNSSHYYPFEQALENLKKSLKYFQIREKQIPTATIYNNLGVIYTWNRDYKNALKNLDISENILKKYDSNEVFEPYCNKAIVYLMKNDCKNALKYIDKSLNNCPKALTLDLRMLKINELIIKLVSGVITLEDFRDLLKNFEGDISLIDDPWYKFQVVYNLKQIVDISYNYNEMYIKNYEDGLTKYYILIAYEQYTFCVGLSPNWRY